MGDPKKLRKSWERPRKMFDKSRIETEKVYVRKYGFKRKKEIWKIKYLFKNYKRRARKILANYDENEEKILINKLARLGVLSKNATLDDVLNLKLEDFFDRRLQTLVYKKGLANTIKHARQLIAHKKIIIGDKIINQPNYLVLKEEEDKIKVKEKKKKAKDKEEYSEEVKSEGKIGKEKVEKTEEVEKVEKSDEEPKTQEVEGNSQEGKSEENKKE